MKRSKQTENRGNGIGEVKTEEETKGEENEAKNGPKPTEPPKDYIHVRARRGQATDSHSLAERVSNAKQILPNFINYVLAKKIISNNNLNFCSMIRFDERRLAKE